MLSRLFETLCGYRHNKNTDTSIAPSAATNLWTTMRTFLINLTTSKATNAGANLVVADDDSAPKVRRKRPLSKFPLHRATVHLQNAIQAFSTDGAFSRRSEPIAPRGARTSIRCSTAPGPRGWAARPGP